MKQVIYDTFGAPPEVLKTVEAPSAPLTPGTVRVKVLRAPINPSDVIQVAGQYGVRPPLPAVAGNEGLGRVVEGDGLPSGQLVLLPGSAGTWVTELIAPVETLIPLPEGDLDQLSMLLVNPATALLLLTEFGGVSAGDWVIQNAANSAVGAYVIQLCKARGINLVNVVRREAAAQDLRARGATHVYVEGPDLAERIKSDTGAEITRGLDSVAGLATGSLAETLSPGADLICFGAISREKISLSPGSFVFNDITLRGFWLLRWIQQASEAQRKETYGALTEMIAKGDLHAPVDRHFSLEEITEAVTYSLAGERKGKVILAPNGL